MNENTLRLADIEKDLIALKKTPAFAFALKANKAEVIVEKTVYLMRCMVADLEGLKGGE